MICLLLALLTISHILDLSQRITSQNDYLDLGVTVLQLPDYQVDSIWTNHKPSVNLAARELLQTWVKNQTNEHEAYTNLIASLRRCQMNQLAAELQQWVEGNVASSVLSPERKFNLSVFPLFFTLLILCCSANYTCSKGGPF